MSPAGVAASPVAPKEESMDEDKKTRLRELREKVRRDIGEAILLIPMERKDAYLEAMEKAPYLFEEESDPLNFLRRCNYNIWDAAERICLYWEERLALFGADRAFLPMLATGDGALDKDDCLSLQAGFPAVLPEKTKSGLQVIYLDRRQHVPSLSSENRLRGMFYTAGYLIGDERAQTEGVVAVFLLATPRSQAVDWTFVEKALYYITKIFPVKVHTWHLVNIPPKVTSNMKKRFLVQDLIVSFTEAMAKTGQSIMDDVEVHFERDGGEILDFFQNDLGLTLPSIPRDFGGTWNFVESTNQWRIQALVEAEKYKYVLQAVKRKRVTLNSKDTVSEGDVSDDSKADKLLAKRRAANVFKARRKRERDKQEKFNLEQELEVLHREHKSLKTEHEHLLSSLKQAQFLVNDYGTDHNQMNQKPPARQHREAYPMANSTSGSGSNSDCSDSS